MRSSKLDLKLGIGNGCKHKKKSSQLLSFDVYLWKPIKVKCHWSESGNGTGIWHPDLHIYL